MLAEAYMNAAGAGQWQASAGSTPTGTVHPMALATLKELGRPTPVIGRNPGTNLQGHKRRRWIKS